MGKSNRDLLEIDKEKVIEELNNAYADEWLAMFEYMSLALNATGKSAFRFAEKLKEIALEELEHAEELAERIAQLGGVVTKDFGKLNNRANCKYPNSFPEDDDIEAMAKMVVKAEECAIDVYDKLLKMTKDKDVLTYNLILHIIEEEAEHETEILTFLGE
jgi:bacterioferritin